jgi:hypothetical protein
MAVAKGHRVNLGDFFAVILPATIKSYALFHKKDRSAKVKTGQF